MRNNALMMLQRVVEYLDEQRRAFGLTQYQLGRKIGRNQATIAQALGLLRHRPKLETIAHIADGLDVEIILDYRPRCPVQVAADPSRELFCCPCGAMYAGPRGEVDATWAPERDRWKVWIPVGPSGYQLQVEQHILKCPIAASRCDVENC